VKISQAINGNLHETIKGSLSVTLQLQAEQLPAEEEIACKNTLKVLGYPLCGHIFSGISQKNMVDNIR
jgi:hypothetical protein